MKNDLPPIMRLPPEILGLIFLQYRLAVKYDSLNLHTTWFYILHVCRLWRTVALSFANLWSMITTHNPSAREFMLRHAVHTSVVLKCIDVSSTLLACHEGRLIREHFYHIAEIEFEFDERDARELREWLKVIASSETAACLRSLSLVHVTKKAGAEPLRRVRAPNILFTFTTLSLAGFRLHLPASRIQTNITSLQLNAEHMRLSSQSGLSWLLATLSLMPNLIHLNLDDWEGPYPQDTLVMSVHRPVSLPQLQTFRYSGETQRYLTWVAHWLLLPKEARRYITLYDTSALRAPPDTLFSGLSNSLSHLLGQVNGRSTERYEVQSSSNVCVNEVTLSLEFVQRIAIFSQNHDVHPGTIPFYLDHDNYQPVDHPMLILYLDVTYHLLRASVSSGSFDGALSAHLSPILKILPSGSVKALRLSFSPQSDDYDRICDPTSSEIFRLPGVEVLHLESSCAAECTLRHLAELSEMDDTSPLTTPDFLSYFHLNCAITDIGSPPESMFELLPDLKHLSLHDIRPHSSRLLKNLERFMRVRASDERHRLETLEVTDSTILKSWIDKVKFSGWLRRGIIWDKKDRSVDWERFIRLEEAQEECTALQTDEAWTIETRVELNQRDAWIAFSF